MASVMTLKDDPSVAPAPEVRALDDIPAARREFFDAVRESAAEQFPLSNEQVTLELGGLSYDEKPIRRRDERKAVLGGRTLARRLQGTFTLKDTQTGETLGQSRKTVAKVPYLTDRGTFLYRGNDWTISNQFNLRPGVYTRRTQSGNVEAPIHTEGGQGLSVVLDPQTSEFRVKIGQSNLKAYPMLRALGYEDDDLRELWGEELLEANRAKADPRALSRIADKITGDTSTENLTERLKTHLAERKIDPGITRKATGIETDHVTPELIGRITQKLIHVSSGQERPSLRDATYAQRVRTPSIQARDMMGRTGRDLGLTLWKLGQKRDLSALPTGVLNDPIKALFFKTGLAEPLEEINPMEAWDKQFRITRGGKGGISGHGVPDEARVIHPSQAGYLDPVRTPESQTIGLDLRASINTFVDREGNLYSNLLNARTGEVEKVPSTELKDLIISFPDQQGEKNPFAIVEGQRQTHVPAEKVDYYIPTPNEMFSGLSNLTPMIGGAHGGRLLMGAKFSSTAMPTESREAPLVQAAHPEGGSFEERLAEKAGAVRSPVAGKVTSVSKNRIKIQDKAGEEHTFELYDQFPLNRKTSMEQSARVRTGQRVEPGDLLATSNFTDDEGTLALGTNLRTGFIASGNTFEDAMALSESAAKKMKAIMLKPFEVELTDETTPGREQFITRFPGKYSREQMKKIDAGGLIKPGTKVKDGDPLILAYKVPENQPYYYQLRGSKKQASDESITWDSPYDGIVTDAAKTSDGLRVFVKTAVPAIQGDKLCFDGETEVLTSEGWKNVADVSLNDEICTLGERDEIEYQRPDQLYRYPEGGRMYRIRSQQVDLFVTEEHQMYIRERYSNEFELKEAKDCFGRRIEYKKDGNWSGEARDYYTIPGITQVTCRWQATRELPPLKVPIDQFMMILGLFLSEGHTFCADGGNYGITIGQSGPGADKIRDALDGSIFTYNENIEKRDGFKDYHRFKICSQQLYEWFKQFGLSHQKYIPNDVFEYPKEKLEILFDWLMFGDGHVGENHPITYYTSSLRLAGDIQRLLLHIGKAGNVDLRREAGTQEILGRVCNVRNSYEVRIINTKLTPGVNHSHTKDQSIQQEYFENDFDGPVYCMEVPNHVLYVRRNGKAVWSGNSVRFGGKGVATIIPDEEMPRDAHGRPLELLISPLAIVSRKNPSLVAEALLGKAAKKRGEPYVVPAFPEGDEGFMQMAMRELKRNNLPAMEKMYEPGTGREIGKVLTGDVYTYRLSQTARGKARGRSLAAYTASGTPARGGKTGGKKISKQPLNALLSHGALDLIKDAQRIRGAKNEEFWNALRLGYNFSMPKIPYVNRKLFQLLKSAGINVKQEGEQLHLMPLRDSETEEWSKGEIQSSEMLDQKTLRPVPGGLMDPSKTGGPGGSSWSHISLPSAMPNPVMEKAIARLLGAPIKRVREVLAGEESLNGESGPGALSGALSKINVGQRIRSLEAKMSSMSATKRDKALKGLKILKMMDKHKIEPSDLMIRKVPVIPPAARPISDIPKLGTPVVSDLNYLYKDLIDLKDEFLQAKGEVPEEVLSSYRGRLYDAVKAIYGTGDPISRASREKKVKGVLKLVFGSGPKHSFLQSKVFGKPQDLSALTVVSPDNDLDIDHVGLPENKAYEIYRPFVIRNLVQSGMEPTDATKAVENQTRRARRALELVTEERPVIVNRAPTLHKFGMMAFWPVLTKGETLQVSPSVVKGFNMDFDGDDHNNTVVISVEVGSEIWYDLSSDPKFSSGRIEMPYFDTQMHGRDGREYFCVNLEDFPHGELLRGDDKRDFYSVPDGLHVLSYDEKKGAVVEAKVAAWSEHRDNEVVTVDLSSDRQIVSDDDPRAVYGIDPEAFEFGRWGPSEAVGKWVPRIQTLPEFDRSIDGIPVESTGRLKEWFPLNRENGYLLGCLVSNGWADRCRGELAGHVCYAMSDPVLQERYKACMSELFVSSDDPKFTPTNNTQYGSSYGDSRRLSVSSIELARFVAPLIGHGVRGKHLPPCYLGAGKDFRIGLLEGLLDNDGSVSISRGKKRPQLMANYSSVSLRLVQETQHLLRSLGIKSRITPSETPAGEDFWVLNIRTIGLQELGLNLSSENKREALEEAPPPKAGSNVSVRYDLVPVSVSLAEEMFRALDHKTHKNLYTKCSNLKRGKGNLPRDTAERIIRVVGRLDHPHWKRFCRIVQDEQVTWDKVESYEETGITETGYDLTVPGYETFMSADGVILSNTGLIHVPVSPGAVKDAIGMMPSSNLRNPRGGEPMNMPLKEMALGLAIASRKSRGRPKNFASEDDVVKAWRRGDVRPDQTVILPRGS